MTNRNSVIQQREEDSLAVEEEGKGVRYGHETRIARCLEQEQKQMKMKMTSRRRENCQTTNQSKGESTIEKGSLDETHSESRGDIQQKSNVKRNGRENGRNLRRSLSRQLSESLTPVKPETTLGWTAFLSTIASLAFAYESRLQTQLTTPPSVYTQNDNKYMDLLREMLADGSKDGLSILTRTIKPSLLVGTRSLLSSTASYAIPHFAGNEGTFVRFREIMTMEADGARIAIDWEIPRHNYSSSVQARKSKQEYIDNVRYGPIQKPVVVILHGINNDASFGYMRSLMRSCTDRGWIACGFNFRGCGHVKLTTPRSYNAGYTGDLRCVIQKIQSRLIDQVNTPVFIVGNSLGANIITKYLGEEGYSKSLPKCVKGGVSLGNPLHIHKKNVHFPTNILLAAGVKKIVLDNWSSFRHMGKCIHFKQALKNTILAKTIGQIDDSMAPYMVRNDSQHPFNTRIGFKDGEDYWHDSSSNRYIQHVTVPLMILSSQDDFLVADPALRSMAHCLCNPLILVVKTKCGGHLGWHEAPPSGSFGIGKSWADTAVSDFFSSVLKTNDLLKRRKLSHVDFPPVSKIVESTYSSTQLKSKL